MQRVRRRAPLPRRADHRDLRGDERDHADRHRRGDPEGVTRADAGPGPRAARADRSRVRRILLARVAALPAAASRAQRGPQRPAAAPAARRDRRSISGSASSSSVPYYVRGIGHALDLLGLPRHHLRERRSASRRPLRPAPAVHRDTGLYAWTLDIFAVAGARVGRRRGRCGARSSNRRACTSLTEGYVILGLISFLMLSLLVFESAGIAAGQLDDGRDAAAARGPGQRLLTRERVRGRSPARGGLTTSSSSCSHLPPARSTSTSSRRCRTSSSGSSSRSARSQMIRTSRTRPSAPRTSTSSPGSRCSTCTPAPSAAAARQCPATRPASRSAPRQLLLDLRDYLYATGRGREAARANAKARRAPRSAELVGDDVIHDELWACTLPRLRGGVPGDDRVRRQDRRHAPPPGAGGGALPGELQRVFKGMETQSATRGASAPRSASTGPRASSIPTIAEKPDAEYLYFVGCAGVVRRPQQEGRTHAFAHDPEEGRRRLRVPRQGGDRATATPRAASATSTSTRRMAQATSRR